jgi:hypothetical protein
VSLDVPQHRGWLSATNDSQAATFIEAAADDVLVAAIIHRAPQRIASLVWNGQPWGKVAQAPTANGHLSLWMLRVTSDAATNLILTMSGSVIALAGIIYRLPGVALVGASPLDARSSSYGYGTAPDSGLAPETAQDDELVFGAVMTDGEIRTADDPVGDWQDGMLSELVTDYTTTGGASGGVGYGATIAVGYRIVSAPGQYRAALNLATPRDWAAVVATFREDFTIDQKPPIVPIPAEHRVAPLEVENPVHSFPTGRRRESVAVVP